MSSKNVCRQNLVYVFTHKLLSLKAEMSFHHWFRSYGNVKLARVGSVCVESCTNMATLFGVKFGNNVQAWNLKNAREQKLQLKQSAPFYCVFPKPPQNIGNPEINWPFHRSQLSADFLKMTNTIPLSAEMARFQGPDFRSNINSDFSQKKRGFPGG